MLTCMLYLSIKWLLALECSVLTVALYPCQDDRVNQWMFVTLSIYIGPVCMFNLLFIVVVKTSDPVMICSVLLFMVYKLVLIVLDARLHKIHP